MAAIAGSCCPPMRELIEAIIAREGAFVVPKSVGWFTCMLEPSPHELRADGMVTRRHPNTRSDLAVYAHLAHQSLSSLGRTGRANCCNLW